MLIGYARVSTSKQETDLQIDALRRAGVDRIVQEKTSSVGRRPELHRLLDGLVPGDRLLVFKLDRLARSLKDLLYILERLEKASAGFASLSEPIDTATPAGRLMLQMLGAVAEFERSLITERSRAGQISAIERGVKFGRPLALTKEQQCQAVAMVEAGQTVSSVSRHFGVSNGVVDRLLGKIKPRERCPVLRRHSDVLSQVLA